VELAIQIEAQNPMINRVAAAIFFLLSTVFVWRSFYATRIEQKE
jgi:hypothetical protein